MENFTYYSPTKVIFGRGVVQGLGRECSALGKRALFLYGRESIKKSGLHGLILSQLQGEGIEVVEHPGVQPNPVLSHAREGAALGRRAKVDFLVAAGGGSVIDEAKAIAAALGGEAPLWDYYRGRAKVEAALPIAAVQTLPATSSEVNQAAVLTNTDTNEKFGLRSPFIVPAVAFLDPELTFTIPLRYTAYACFDIMTHMLEGYLTTTAEFSPVQDGYCQGLIRAVMDSLERVLQKPDDYDARASIMWAGSLGWNGLANAGLAGARIPNHMLEHPLSALYDVPHGAGLAVVVPPWMARRAGKIAPRIVKFGTGVLGLDGLGEMSMEDAASRVITEFGRWIKSIGCPSSLRELGILNPDIDELVRQSLVLARKWNITDHDEGDIRSILEDCL